MFHFIFFLYIISIYYFYILSLYIISIYFFYILFLYIFSIYYFYILFLYTISIYFSIYYFYILFLYIFSIYYHHKMWTWSLHDILIPKTCLTKMAQIGVFKFKIFWGITLLGRFAALPWTVTKITLSPLLPPPSPSSP